MEESATETTNEVTDEEATRIEFGKVELMWRCMEGGEMGRIEDGLPEECPNCGESREALMYWTED